MAGTNTDQIAYWNETSGPKWVALQDLLDVLTEPAGRLAIARAAPRDGERVLDVGCGCGQTTLWLADAVGKRGHVTGLDVSRPMLARARERVAAAGLAHVELIEADAQTYPVPAGLDLVFSRFGVMFFEDPASAFANLASALRPGGRMTFVCWRPMGENPWMTLPLQAAAKHVPLPEPGPQDAPGPFALADPDRLRGILEGAGLRAVEVVPHTVPVTVAAGAPLAAALDFMLDVGPTAALLREAPDAVRRDAMRSLEAALAPHHSDAGVVLSGAVWVASGRAPE